ncbi:GNAT family N-acetyltransferase [Pelagibacterium xiamenense]|uniref:GNAT family N-acetyltransferase n=1 Tax=Pelagibacterium xiamenense TaxID=2901140 RepID=UPI001E308A9F|nr:GNAT family N-acetyltransferase [Pelagibacterium xiamenense]MCD7061440.1 GNAT family N-acetyltransferase [Pelagibacterium xiamenense]
MDAKADITPIVSDRLVLRPPVLDDAPDITRLANNEKLHAVLARVPYPYTEADAVDFITNVVSAPNERIYAITLARTGALVGVIGLTFADGKPPELGYWLGEPYWGNGYATEAVNAILGAVTASEPVIAARVIATNRASCAVLEKAGFVLTGEAIDDCGPHKGVMVADYRYEAG